MTADTDVLSHDCIFRMQEVLKVMFHLVMNVIEGWFMEEYTHHHIDTAQYFPKG